MNCTYRSMRHFFSVLFCKWKKVEFEQVKTPKYIHFLSTDIEAD